MGYNSKDPRPGAIPTHSRGGPLHARQGPLSSSAPSPGADLVDQGAEQRENRSIVNVSSTSGLHGNVGQANYAAAKSAITGFTRTVAKEWGVFGVRANTVAFGYILTRQD
jgi:NAD(P)-dependent dehydrogenase (short-subunit alcohol dehydrogenase family)